MVYKVVAFEKGTNKAVILRTDHIKKSAANRVKEAKQKKSKRFNYSVINLKQ